MAMNTCAVCGFSEDELFNNRGVVFGFHHLTETKRGHMICGVCLEHMFHALPPEQQDDVLPGSDWLFTGVDWRITRQSQQQLELF